MEGLDGADDVRGAGVILVDIVRREEVLATTRGVELVVEATVRVRSHRCDELRGFALRRLDQGSDGVGGLGAGHLRRKTHVGEVGFVEGQHPFGRVARVHDVDGGLHVGCKGHHGYEAGGCVW